jgi:peptide/nickel transport system substrate-binding protein
MHKKYHLLVILITLSLIFSACKTETATPSAPTEPPPTKVPAQEPTEAPAKPTEAPTEVSEVEEACLKIALIDSASEGNSLDPINVIASESSAFMNAVYNRLLDMDSEFVVSPELAESFESNEDASEWTFHLRKGVKFHDGHELTSKDVVWTFKRLIDPDVGSEARAYLTFLTPEGIIAIDDYTVKFVLENPVPELPILITAKNTWIVPDGSTEETLTANGVGTGPFIPVDFEPVQQPHTFVKNPDYWDAGLPKSECLELYLIEEATTRNSSLQSGEIDIVQNVDFASIAVLEQDPNINLLSTAASTSLTLSMWVDTPPFDDIRVRQALKKVVDRQVMVDLALQGFGEIGDDNPIPPSSPYAWRSEVPPRDVEGAKQLLEDAGYGPDNPLKIELYTSDALPGSVSMAQIFKEQAAEAGIEVEVIISPVAEYWDNVWLKQPFLTSGWVLRHPGEAFGIAYHGESEYNETHWIRPDFDALLEQATTTGDPELRLELYQQLMQMLSEEGGVIIPMFYYAVAGIRAECTGYTPHVQFYKLDFKNAYCER